MSDSRTGPPVSIKPEELYPKESVMEILGISVHQFHSLRAKGMPSVEFGRGCFVCYGKDLIDWFIRKNGK